MCGWVRTGQACLFPAVLVWVGGISSRFDGHLCNALQATWPTQLHMEASLLYHTFFSSWFARVRQHTPGGIACAQKWAAFHAHGG
jgi:hypothetical protein